MKTQRNILLLLAALLLGNIAFGQTLERTVVASAAETLLGPIPKDFTLSYVLGEVAADIVPPAGGTNTSTFFLTVGFAQPDIELQQVLNMDITKSILVYPNPTSGNTVKLAFNNQPDGVYAIDVIDPIGRVLQSQSVSYFNNNFFYLTLDISAFKGGVYFIRVINPMGFQGNVKLIKI